MARQKQVCYPASKAAPNGPPRRAQASRTALTAARAAARATTRASTAWPARAAATWRAPARPASRPLTRPGATGRRRRVLALPSLSGTRWHHSVVALRCPRRAAGTSASCWGRRTRSPTSAWTRAARRTRRRARPAACRLPPCGVACRQCTVLPFACSTVWLITRTGARARVRGDKPVRRLGAGGSGRARVLCICAPGVTAERRRAGLLPPAARPGVCAVLPAGLLPGRRDCAELGARARLRP